MNTASTIADVKSRSVATAKMFPRVANCCGFLVGGPLAAHQLKSVLLAVHREIGNSSKTNTHRLVERVIR